MDLSVDYDEAFDLKALAERARAEAGVPDEIWAKGPGEDVSGHLTCRSGARYCHHEMIEQPLHGLIAEPSAAKTPVSPITDRWAAREGCPRNLGGSTA